MYSNEYYEYYKEIIMSIINSWSPSNEEMIETAIKIIRQKGDCNDTTCDYCFIAGRFCRNNLYKRKPEHIVRIQIAYLIAVKGEQWVKKLIVEELV